VPFDGAFSPLHWLIVGVVVLLVFGPDRLPELAKQLGKGMRELRMVQQHLRDELRDLAAEMNVSDPPPSPMDDTTSGSSAGPPPPAIPPDMP
jgi:TatA/E family protein of Tat protein translocase